MIAIILYYYIYIIIYKGKTKASRREGQSLDGLPSFPPRPRPLPSPPSGDKGKAEQKSKKKGRKRENQGEGCRRHLFPFLASLLFRLLPPPSTPSPAAHHLATVEPATRARGRAATPSDSGLCYRHTSPPHRHRPATGDGRTSSRLSLPVW